MPPLHIRGRPAAPGFAMGPLQILLPAPETRRERGRPSSEEAQALRQAIAKALVDLGALTAAAVEAMPPIWSGSRSRCWKTPRCPKRLSGWSPGACRPRRAWAAVLDAEIVRLPGQRGRVFPGQGQRSRRHPRPGLGQSRRHGSAAHRPGAIVVAADLTPSVFLSADWRDGGIALRDGSTTSHVAMLARSRGVPMVVGLDDAAAADRSGTSALLDGAQGLLVVDPDASVAGRIRTATRIRHHRSCGDAVHHGGARPRPADGTRVLGSPEHLRPGRTRRARSGDLRRHRPRSHRASVRGRARRPQEEASAGSLPAHPALGSGSHASPSARSMPGGTSRSLASRL